MAQATINLRMDAALKKEMEAVCKAMGMNLTTAFTIFSKKVTGERRIPFEVSVPEQLPPETMAALHESDDIINGRIQAKTYNSAAELIREAQEEVNAENQADIAV